MLDMTVEFKARILNDGLITVVSGPEDELLGICEELEKDCPELCGWLDEDYKH